MFLLTLSRSLTRNDLVEYVKTHYRAPRMVLSAAGGINHEHLVELANKHLGSLSNSLENLPALPTRCRFTGKFLNREVIQHLGLMADLISFRI